MLLRKILNRIILYYNIYSSKKLKKSFGEDFPDKTFYIIGIDYCTEGLFAILKNTLIHIHYAIEKGYIPVVDMKNYTSQFSKLTDGNAWEIFFKQPMEYSLDDIQKAKNVIFSKNITNWGSRSIFPNIVDDCNITRRLTLSGLFKKYIIPNERTREYIEGKYTTIIGDKTNVMGLLCRGTDYTQKRPKGHPIQPNLEQIIAEVDRVIKEEGCEYIYVATEDENIIDQLKNKYSDRILEIGQKRFGKMDVNYISELNIRDLDLIKLNLDYYASLTILSRCSHFLGGRTAGTIGVSLMNTDFKTFYTWNLGRY